MNFSNRIQTRLMTLNLAIWLAGGIILLSLAGGPRGVVANHLQPIGDELGGWSGLLLGAAGWQSDETLPRYELDIEPRIFEAAELFNRSEDFDSSKGADRWWFPAEFVANGVRYPVDVQLRQRQKSVAQQSLRERSWRIRFQDKDGHLGMTELEIAPANEQRHALELSIRDSARSMGLLSPPGGFASLHINGVEIGSVFWSEGDSRAMLDRLGFSQGEILSRADRAVTIPARLTGSAHQPVTLGRHQPSIQDRQGASRVASRKLERLYELTRNAKPDDFERRVSELLDVEKYLRWNALAWVFGDRFGADPEAASWYFDPVTGLLEPMVRGLAPPQGSIASSAIAGPDSGALTARLLESPQTRSRRNQILWELVGPSGSELVKSADSELGDALTRIARSQGMLIHVGTLGALADFRRERRDWLAERVASLEIAVSASRVETTTAVRSVRAGRAQLSLDLVPAGLAPIQLTELRLQLGPAIRAHAAPARLILLDPNGEPVRQEFVETRIVGGSVELEPVEIAIETGIWGSEAGSEGVWRLVVELPFVDSASWQEPDALEQIDVAYRNAFTGESLPSTRLIAGEAIASNRTRAREELPSVAEAIARSGLPLVVAGEELVLPVGDHLLNESLVIPPTHALRIEAGVSLRMAPGVNLISFRGIQAEGTAERPIEIRAADPERPFGAVAVARSSQVSHLSHVTISGGSGASFDGIEFGGELSFNASDVVLRDSEISHSRGGDGLSLKRASFEVIRTAFEENDSDGIDADWSRGVIVESMFSNNGDDGLDLASSNVSIDDSSFDWMKDKSINAGARSQVSVGSTRFFDSKVAITSKDGSEVEVRDSEFRRNQIGFALYRGKPVYSGGSGTVVGGVFAQNERDVSVEPGSHLELIRVQHEAAPPIRILMDAVALEGELEATPIP